MQLACMAYFVVLTVLVIAGLLSGLVLLLICLMNAASYWFYAQDKEAAQLGGRRVSEQTLHILAFLGGWPPLGWHNKSCDIKHKTTF